MMTLVLDTSSQYMVVAIMNDLKVCSYRFEKLDRQHAEQLLPTINAILDEAQARITDVSSIIVSNGPGSFTGVRLAITFVKTLALTQSLSVYAIPSLAFLAKPNQAIFASLDARANRHYVAAFNGFESVLNPTIMTQEEQRVWLSSHPTYTTQQIDQPSLHVGDLFTAVIQWKNFIKPLENVHLLTPLYLKDLQ